MVKKQIALLPVEIKEQIAKAKYFMTRYIFIDRYMQVRDSNQPIRKDATNMLKTTEDAVMAELKQDDKRVFHTSLHKIHISDESKGRFILSIAAFDHMPTVREFYEECGRVSDEPYDRLYV
jgi:Holliday junction resolvase RusA-like endonuclease